MRAALRLAGHLAILLSAAACAAKPGLQTSTRCPPLAVYQADFQKRVAELVKTDERPGAWRVRKIFEDYGQLRAMCRALTE